MLHLKYPQSGQVQLYFKLTHAKSTVANKFEHIQWVFVPTVAKDAKNNDSELNVLERNISGLLFQLHALYLQGSINHFVNVLLWSGFNKASWHKSRLVLELGSSANQTSF